MIFSGLMQLASFRLSLTFFDNSLLPFDNSKIPNWYIIL